MATLKNIPFDSEVTNSKVYFTFTGEFTVDEITSIMQLNYTHAFNKGEQMSNFKLGNDSTPRYYKFSRWSYGTDYENTRDIKEQLSRVIIQLKDKMSEINAIKECYKCETTLVVVPVIKKGCQPSLYFDQEVLNFCTITNTDIDVDIYASPYDETENIIENHKR